MLARVNSTPMQSALKKLADALADDTQAAADNAAAVAQRSAQATTKFNDRSGELRRRIYRGRDVSGTPNAFVRAYAPWAKWVEDGTRPHVIRARGGFLRFTVGSQIVYTRRVQHHGTRATHFMRDARELAAISFLSGARAAIGNAARTFRR